MYILVFIYIYLQCTAYKVTQTYVTMYMCVCQMQSECDRLASSKKELETKLAEMTTQNESLEAQHNKEAKKCRLMEVLSSPFYQLMTM